MEVDAKFAMVGLAEPLGPDGHAEGAYSPPRRRAPARLGWLEMRRPRVLIVMLSAALLLLLAACSGQTTGANNVTATTATLNGDVSCSGGSPTPCSWYFRWSIYSAFPATPATHQSQPTEPLTDDVSNVPVAQPLTGLIQGTTYYFQLCGRGDDLPNYVCVGPDGSPNTYGSFTTSSASSMPPLTWSGIHLAEVFNYNESPICCNSPPIGSKTGEQGLVDYVWGADGRTGDVPAAGVWHDTYIPWARDPNDEAPSHFQAQHPTWVEYRCDANGDPLRDSNGNPVPAVYPGDPTNAELDTTNPDVQSYYETWAESELASGFEGISWDNGVVWNQAAACGHFDAGNNWVHQYSGALQDSTWAQAQSQAFGTVVAGIKRQYPNATSTVNQRYKCDTDWADSLPTTSMILDEGAFTDTVTGTWLDMGSNENWCSAGAWWATVQTYVTMQRDEGKGLVLINYDNTPGLAISDFVTDTNETARAHLQWVLANYLLLRYAHTYLEWENEDNSGGPLANQHEYGSAAGIGTATGDYYFAQGVAMREFTHGIAIVNPDPRNSYTVTLSSGYTDLYGNTVSSITMAPDSGAVLLEG